MLFLLLKWRLLQTKHCRRRAARSFLQKEISFYNKNILFLGLPALDWHPQLFSIWVILLSINLFFLMTSQRQFGLYCKHIWRRHIKSKKEISSKIFSHLCWRGIWRGQERMIGCNFFNAPRPQDSRQSQSTETTSNYWFSIICPQLLVHQLLVH